MIDGGSGDDTVYAGDGSDTIQAGEGNDYIDAGAGADTMAGGTGNDTYIVDNSGDVVTELPDSGFDTVQSSVTYELPADVENLALTGTSDINGTGNALDNVITGNTSANMLYGLEGNDTLTGNADNDTLDGGLGADTLIGGAGNDTYYIDNIGDAITENANEGTDTVNSNITYTLGANLENLTLAGTDSINASGNELNNILTGNAGNNILDGKEGADIMSGGAGNDTYIVDNAGDVVNELANEGNDTVYSAIDHTLGSNIENLILTGDTAIAGTGNELNNVITGNSSANILNGGPGDDTILGGSGDDIINAGEGADIIIGGVGNDTLTGGAGNDTYTYNAGDGLDYLNDSSGIDTLKMGAGIDFDHTIIRIEQGVAHLRLLDTEGSETSDGMDIILNPDGTLPLETIAFADGSAFNADDLVIRSKTTYGTKRATSSAQDGMTTPYMH